MHLKGVMVRLMLVLAPVMCILGGIGGSCCLDVFVRNLNAATEATSGLSASGTLSTLCRALGLSMGGGDADQAAKESALKKEKEPKEKAASAKDKRQRKSELKYPWKHEVCERSNYCFDAL